MVPGNRRSLLVGRVNTKRERAPHVYVHHTCVTSIAEQIRLFGSYFLAATGCSVHCRGVQGVRRTHQGYGNSSLRLQACTCHPSTKESCICRRGTCPVAFFLDRFDFQSFKQRAPLCPCCGKASYATSSNHIEHVSVAVDTPPRLCYFGHRTHMQNKSRT